jgi:hypothetical protein
MPSGAVHPITPINTQTSIQQTVKRSLRMIDSEHLRARSQVRYQFGGAIQADRTRRAPIAIFCITQVVPQFGKPGDVGLGGLRMRRA